MGCVPARSLGTRSGGQSTSALAAIPAWHGRYPPPIAASRASGTCGACGPIAPPGTRRLIRPETPRRHGGKRNTASFSAYLSLRCGMLVLAGLRQGARLKLHRRVVAHPMGCPPINCFYAATACPNCFKTRITVIGQIWLNLIVFPQQAVTCGVLLIGDKVGLLPIAGSLCPHRPLRVMV